MMIKIFNSKPVVGRLSFFNRFRLPAQSLKLLFVAAIFFFGSCSDDDDEPKSVVLLDATSVLTRTASELQTYVPYFQIDVDPQTFQYDVEIFKVTYKTTYKDSEIVASGLVIIPKTTEAVGMVSFQHGTIVVQSDAPTTSPLNHPYLILYAALSSAGFIAVIPDYIGFGESADLFHPYYVEEATADAVIDNLKAAKEFAAEKKIKFNGKLFLAGYSQGGYATMAAHKAIELEGLEGFDLIASFPASGGYDIKAFQEYFFQQTSYQEPFYLPYVALSYQSYYDWPGTSLSDFFTEPYASRIPELYDGINNSAIINAQLTENIQELIQPDVLANIDTDPKYDYLVDAFNENSLLDWTPTETMFMYHGDADVTVPYQNSVDAYNQLIANGASTSTLTFITIEGGDHGTGVFPYLEDFLNKLILLK
jgi:pimeloyl-ACP methyl ester carboxylesterase